MVKAHELLLPLTSVAVMVTVLGPTGKWLPEGGAATTPATPQLSIPSGSPQVTKTSPHYGTPSNRKERTAAKSG